MEKKVHYKLYKRGKLWCCALIATAALTLGIAGTTAHADADTGDTATPVTTTASTSSSAVTETSAVAASGNATSALAAEETVAPVSSVVVPADNDLNANYGHLDQSTLTVDPNTGQASLQVAGWQAAGQSVNMPYRYAILYDQTAQTEIARQRVDSVDRPDVGRIYTNVANSQQSGFTADFQLPNNLAGHTVSVVARYSNDAVYGEGDRVDYWCAPIVINDENLAHIDGLANDQAGTLTVSGWHASNQAFGRRHHFIIAFDASQGHEIARQESTLVSRPDVQKAFPSLGNAGFSGFSVNFSLTPAYSQDNIQFISRWTDDPAGNGNYIDYWFSPVQKVNRGYLDSWSLSNGQLAVNGWHANDASVYQPYHYLILVDSTAGQQVASALVPTIAAPDLTAAFPEMYSAGQSRFSYQFANDIQLVSGHTYNLVSRYSANKQGNGDLGNPADYTDYWYPAMTLDQRAGWVDEYQIDPGNKLHVSGWMTNDAAINYHNAFVLALANGGRELARQAVQLFDRPDIAKYRPDIYQSAKSGFDTTIQLPADVGAGDLQFVLRFSDQTNGEGHYSDIWLAPITNGLMKNRTIINGDHVYYYNNDGQSENHFISNGVLYRTDGRGNIQNKYNPGQLNIGGITFTGDLTGISKANKRPVQLQINFKDGTTINAWATVKWQGDSSLQWPKKGYRLKLFKDEAMTKKLKLKLPGSGFKTNSFNLKACFTDPTAGLNIVNAHLFSEITASREGLADSIVNKMPNYGQVAGLPLELGINGLDQGLYVLETYQEDKLYDLNDKKADNLAIASKANSGLLTTFAQPLILADLQEAAFETKSPAKLDQSGVDYFNQLYQLANAGDSTYQSLEAQYLDVPAAIDYLAFSFAINNIDGVNKNITFISKKGSKWVLMPYDLDTTWDNSWNGTMIGINNDFAKWLSDVTHNRLLLNIYHHHQKEIISRYQELRQGVLSTANVTKEFNQWFDQVGTAAYHNNDQLWGDINLSGNTHRLSITAAEFDQVIAQRLTTVDQQFGLA